MPAKNLPLYLDSVYSVLRKGDIATLARFMTDPDACYSLRKDMEENYNHDSCAELWLDATTCLVCPARSVSQQAKRLHMARMIRSMLMNLSDVEVSSIMRKILLKTFKDDAKDSEPTFDMSADQVILWYQSAKLLTDEDAKQLNTFVWRGLKAAKAEALPA